MSAEADTPIARLRAEHRLCSVPCFIHSLVGDRAHCWQCARPWPCDTIAALDALEVEGRDIQFRMFELQTRLDAATVLIRGAQMDEHMNHGASLKQAALRTCEHPHCAPFREWLAGDKEEHGE